MPIVTLTTDLGNEDFYLSTVKAQLHVHGLDISLIDITNNIVKHDIAHAAFVLKNVLHQFPVGTIHLIGVATGSIDRTRHLGIDYDGQKIICADNGFFSLIASKQADLIVELSMNLKNDFKNFPLRDLYTQAAAHLCRGGTLEVIGKRTEEYLKRTMLQPLIGNDYIKGVVTYVDHFGNAITNIHSDLIKEIGKGRTFLIGLKHRGYEINRISDRYSDENPSDRLAIFNSAGYLEISINQGNADQLLGVDLGEPVIMTFDD